MSGSSFLQEALLSYRCICFAPIPPPILMSSSSLLLSEVRPAFLFVLTSPRPRAAQFVFLSDPLGRAALFANRPRPAVSLRLLLAPRLPRRPARAV